MAGIPSPTEAVRSALKIILGTTIVNRKEPISATLIHDWQISSSNFDIPVELRHITLYALSCAGLFKLDDISRIRRNEVLMVI